MIIYEGPSALDGKPIVAIATGFSGTRNTKTGNMIQTWIIRADIEPHIAIRSDADQSICGGCIRRPANREALKKQGERACYVKTFQGPLAVYRAFKRGKYPALDLSQFDDKPVRFGAYGDPAAVPFDIWQQISARASNTTGYTHQWREHDLAAIAMASCDTPSDREHAKAQGYRTFRTKRTSDRILPGEIVCPASKEAGQRTTCEHCRLCRGAGSGKDIVINLH